MILSANALEIPMNILLSFKDVDSVQLASQETSKC